MGNISVSLKPSGSQVPPSGGGGGSWGSVYWQYFEDLDKITAAETPLKLVKKLFIEKNSVNTNTRAALVITKAPKMPAPISFLAGLHVAVMFLSILCL
mgnify:CR=1 FL=1